MKNDIIKCDNCGKEFKDDTKEASNTYQWQGQNSRTGKFNNMCPFCYGTNTTNTHKETKEKQKFISEGESIRRKGAHVKSSKRIKRPNLSTEHIQKKVLGDIQPFNIKEDGFPTGRTQPKSESIEDENFYKNHTKEDVVVVIVAKKIAPVKAFTPIELMERKLTAQRKELLLPPDNLNKYRGWRYDRRYKNECKKIQ